VSDNLPLNNNEKFIYLSMIALFMFRNNDNNNDLVNLLRTIESNLREYESSFRVEHFSSYPKIDIPFLSDLLDEVFTAFDEVEPEQLKDIIIFWLNKNIDNPYKEKSFLNIPTSYGLGKKLKSIEDYINPILEETKRKNNSLLQFLEKGIDLEIFEDDALNCFFMHDISHLTNDYIHFLLNLTDKKITSLQNIKDKKEHIIKILKDYNDNPEDLFNAPVLSYKMLHYLATSRLNMPPLSESFSIDEICLKAAQIVGFRGFSKGFLLTEEYSKDHQNQIVVDCEPIESKGNPGCLFSLVYNLLKNSFKKTNESNLDNKHLFIHAYEGPNSTYIISVGDNMDPIDLNMMKKRIREKILREGLENLDLSKKISHKFSEWQNSPYKIAIFRHSEITDLTYLARLSGSELSSYSINSGLGLYGLSNIIKEMNGRILYGESFKTGGPIFSIILSKDLSTDRFSKLLDSTRTYMTQQRLYHSGTLKTI
jgi:hypothetical protein